MSLYGVDPEIIMSDQMPLHRNESSQEKTLSFKGASQTTFVKENHMLSRERITVMTSVTSKKTFSGPGLEFVFKGVGKRVKLNPPPSISIQWAPKGSYRLEHVLKFIEKVVPAQPCALFPKKRKIFTLDDYSAHLDPAVKEALYKKGYFLVILPGGITGDLQVNDTDLHHPAKFSYREKEAALMIEKLRANPEKIPTPNRDDVMQMFKSAWSDASGDVDSGFAFKRNALTIKLDGSEDHLVSSKLKALVWEEMVEFRTKLLDAPHPKNMRQLQAVMIPPDGVKRELDEITAGVPVDEGYELLDGDFSENELADDENEDDSEDDSTSDTEQQIIPDNISTASENESAPADPDVLADFACLSRIEAVISSEKVQSSISLLPFFIKMENALAQERQRCRNRKKEKTRETNDVQEDENDQDTTSSTDDDDNSFANIGDDANIFDILNTTY